MFNLFCLVSIFKNYFYSTYLCVGVWACAHECRCWQRLKRPIRELELQAVLGHHVHPGSQTPLRELQALQVSCIVSELLSC